MVTPVYIPFAIINAVEINLVCQCFPRPLRSTQAEILEMMGTIDAVRELGRPTKSVLQDLFEEPSTGGNEAKVRFLYNPVRNVS